MEFNCHLTFHSIIDRIIENKVIHAMHHSDSRAPGMKVLQRPFYFQVAQNGYLSLVWIVERCGRLVTSNLWPRHDPEMTRSTFLIKMPPVDSCAASWACHPVAASSFLTERTMNERMIKACSTKSVDVPWNYGALLQPRARGRSWPSELRKRWFPFFVVATMFRIGVTQNSNWVWC